MGRMESTRVDRWLWAVRLFKTRAAANEACRAGHVRLNGARVKPAASVRVGDTLRVRGADRERIVEVARVIANRVGAPIAAECIIDHSPPPPTRPAFPQVPERERGAGRPTKRERRQLERSRGRRRT
jgi:ribosome-associated heat shock protein Hsp15